MIAVVFASKHESTHEVAEAIAGELRAGGLVAEVFDATELDGLPDAEGYVLGSGVYGGRWLKPMRDLVRAGGARLGERPVWIFSVGPIGDAEQRAKAGIDDGEMVAATSARDNVVFAGRLEPADLGLGERMLVKAVKAPAGDYRDWDAIRGWARSVATDASAANGGG